jgi:hypothetical protein
MKMKNQIKLQAKKPTKQITEEPRQTKIKKIDQEAKKEEEINKTR